MGSTGTGNFSDYKNYPKAIKGVTGADDSEDKCALAFKVRLLVKSNEGLIIGYLPTKYNYLRNCILKGFTYTGVVSNASSTPINTVVVDITPSAV